MQFSLAKNAKLLILQHRTLKWVKWVSNYLCLSTTFAIIQCSVSLFAVSPMNVLDLFSGPGGLSLGLEAAGFSVRAAVELNRDAMRTYSLHTCEAQLLDCTEL